ncbi:MAG TPA: T9SS type A sorting domain-containing protein, partial [Hymenobacter sp.]|nr:T9SS type A sorting domain-containing protein [Hymenobacter sp.]
GTAGEASFTYNWLAACNGGSNARIGVGVSAESLVNVRIIGNPVRNGQVSVEVRGATGQLLRLNLTDMRGQMIGTHQVEQADSVEHHTFEVSRQTTGLLLLRVTTPTQSQTVKVIKVE